jgi:hypothetical protein
MRQEALRQKLDAIFAYPGIIFIKSIRKRLRDMKQGKKHEVFVITGIFAVMAVIFAVQAALVLDAANLFFNIGNQVEPGTVTFYEEFPEARVTSTDALQSVFATVTIQCQKYSSLEKAVLLINGEEVGNFRDKQLTVKVADRDVLAIDGSFYIHELVFEVVAASQNIAQPEIGQTVRVYQDIGILGEVRLK